MRRAGHNPTDIEVQDMINKIDSDAGTLTFKVGGGGQKAASPSRFVLQRK